MRVIFTLLVLLLSMCGAQTQSTQTEVQTESQITGDATAAVTTELDISAELRELRDMVVELRVLLTVTQNGVEDLKIEKSALETRLTASEAEVMTLKLENSAIKTDMKVLKTRLAASETEVVNLRNEIVTQTADLRSVAERLVASETDMEHVKRDTTAQHTDLTTMKTEVMNLIKENSAQETDMVVVKTKLDTGIAEIEKLKLENVAQEAELTAVKTRLAATEIDVVNLENEITGQPKVAFSAGLTNSGFIESGNNELNLVFTKIITNVGQAYSSITGFFTAPVKGVYYFRFTVFDGSSDYMMSIKMFKNGDQIMHLEQYDVAGNHSYLSGGVTLQLEMGDVVNLRLPPNYHLWDITANHCIFSGFLLFPL